MIFKARVNVMVTNRNFHKVGKLLFVANLGENVEDAQKAYDVIKEVYPEPDYKVQLLAETTIRLPLKRAEDCYAELQKHCESMCRPAHKAINKEVINA